MNQGGVDEMITVMGATGNVGSVIADTLLSKGARVRVIGRDKSRMKRYADRGAEIHAGSGDDVSFLTRCFEGSRAAFLMIPPNTQAPDMYEYLDRMGQAASSAAAAAKVPRILHLSSIGAELESGTGPIAGLYRQEERLNRLNAEIVHLRPGYFMENFLFLIDMIKHMGILGSPMGGDVPVSMIATRDIGKVAAETLFQNFTGKSVVSLRGPENVTMLQAASILGESIGKPALPYVQFPYEDAEKAMIQSGFSASFARGYVEMNQAFNDGKIVAYQEGAAEITPTALRNFANNVFSKAFH